MNPFPTDKTNLAASDARIMKARPLLVALAAATLFSSATACAPRLGTGAATYTETFPGFPGPVVECEDEPLVATITAEAGVPTLRFAEGVGSLCQAFPVLEKEGLPLKGDAGTGYAYDGIGCDGRSVRIGPLGEETAFRWIDTHPCLACACPVPAIEGTLDFN